MFGQTLGDAHVANGRVVRKDKGFSHSSLLSGFYRFQRVNDLKEVVQMANGWVKCSTCLSTLEQMALEVFFGGRAGEYIGHFGNQFNWISFMVNLKFHFPIFDS
jgi:hypothetical protein